MLWYTNTVLVAKFVENIDTNTVICDLQHVCSIKTHVHLVTALHVCNLLSHRDTNKNMKYMRVYIQLYLHTFSCRWFTDILDCFPHVYGWWCFVGLWTHQIHCRCKAKKASCTLMRTIPECFSMYVWLVYRCNIAWMVRRSCSLSIHCEMFGTHNPFPSVLVFNRFLTICCPIWIYCLVTVGRDTWICAYGDCNDSSEWCICDVYLDCTSSTHLILVHYSWDRWPQKVHRHHSANTYTPSTHA